MQNSHVLLFCFQKKILQNTSKTYTLMKASGGIFPCSFASTKMVNACSRFQFWASKHLKIKNLNFFFFKNFSLTKIYTYCLLQSRFILDFSAISKRVFVRYKKKNTIRKIIVEEFWKKNYLTFDSSNVEWVTNNVSLTIDIAGPGLSNATNIRLKCFTG